MTLWCVVFENSTVCDSRCMFFLLVGLFWLVGFVFDRYDSGFLSVLFWLVLNFSMESLILAQDERWRRA